MTVELAQDENVYVFSKMIKTQFPVSYLVTKLTITIIHSGFSSRTNFSGKFVKYILQLAIHLNPQHKHITIMHIYAYRIHDPFLYILHTSDGNIRETKGTESK